MGIISQRTITYFYDLLSSWSTVAKIERLFEDEGISKKRNHSSDYDGQRRKTADSYVANLDLSDWEDISKLLKVMEVFLLTTESNISTMLIEDYKTNIEQFKKLMKRDGFNWSNEKFESEDNFITNDIQELKHFGIPTINKELKRATNQLFLDPEDSITAARSMVESTFKYILDDLGIKYKEKGNLYKKVSKELNFSPDQHGEEVFKNILGNISAIVTGFNSIRNTYGDSHGKGITYGRPSTRHAKFTVSISVALCIFLLETYQRRKKQESNP
ncbi:abortive infection family protein [Melghirimyces algeriensis]|uniref:Abortive infection C-terminus n=1 Tax=Melghirimyces algeriensis TaxID=910412 RepID=A0A521F4F5_9BACL|nr:abortive infection family protein [Melghirimyces algeriensis]SMO91062.1 Abortive infection C-terminus [Melghirimyces algeriensis]